MKTQQRRVINIKKDDYDEIKAFCDANALKISEWIVLEIKKIIIKLNEN
jgi:hypothetical protein